MAMKSDVRTSLLMLLPRDPTSKQVRNMICTVFPPITIQRGRPALSMEPIALPTKFVVHPLHPSTPLAVMCSKQV